MKILKDPAKCFMSLPEILIWREELRKRQEKLVVTNGCFDILHRGHAEYMRNARNFGDALLVLLNSDESVRSLKGPSRPINKVEDRAYMLASLAFVDAVSVFHTERCTDCFLQIKPDVYVKGGDYTFETLNPEEREALVSVGAEIKFIPFISGFSTTSILAKI